MSTGAQPFPHRVHWPHRWVVWLVAGLVAAAGIAVGVDRAFLAGQETRSEFMQGVLDGVVSGPNRLAPGATAYVSGPHGTWVGSAGVANVRTVEPMRSDARMRIESNSKTWVEAVILQLLGEGKLSVDDTVDRWLPGLLRAHGSEITIRELMSDSSGLIDDNDVFASPSASPCLSRACRRSEAAGGAARGRRPDTSESGSRGLATLVHPARRLAAPGRPARHHLPPLQHRLEHRRPDRRQGRRQAAPAALP